MNERSPDDMSNSQRYCGQSRLRRLQNILARGDALVRRVRHSPADGPAWRELGAVEWAVDLMADDVASHPEGLNVDAAGNLIQAFRLELAECRLQASAAPSTAPPPPREPRAAGGCSIAV
jgi:hypothetical protein